MKISLFLNIDYQFKTNNKSLSSYLSVVLLCFLIHNPVYAQTIQGRLMDLETGVPISAANIYFSNYLLGTFSDDSGYFELSLPAQRPSQLVILHVNYENKYITISKSFIHPEKWIIELSPQVRNLEEVIISSKKDREWKKNLRSFTDAFFGKTENAKKCEIINPYILNFTTSKGELIAQATELIVIRNNATGYKVYFHLENFRMQDNNVSFSGKPFFEPLSSTETRDQQAWNRNRKRTYMGSIRHFLKTLIDGSSFNEGYEIYYGRVDGNGNFLKRGFMTPSDLILKEKESCFLEMKEMLQIVYTKETLGTSGQSHGSVIEDSGGSNQHELSRLPKDQTKSNDDFQVSYIFGKRSKLAVSETGLLERPDLIQVFGYWAEEGAADLLPFDYPIAD